MTGLSTRKAAQFFRGDDFVSAQHVTIASGIQALVPGAGELLLLLPLESSNACFCLFIGRLQHPALVPGAGEHTSLLLLLLLDRPCWWLVLLPAAAVCCFQQLPPP